MYFYNKVKLLSVWEKNNPILIGFYDFLKGQWNIFKNQQMEVISIIL